MSEVQNQKSESLKNTLQVLIIFADGLPQYKYLPWGMALNRLVSLQSNSML